MAIVKQWSESAAGERTAHGSTFSSYAGRRRRVRRHSAASTAETVGSAADLESVIARIDRGNLGLARK